LAIKQLSSVLDSAESQLSDVERNDIEAKIQKLTIELKMKEGELDDEQIDTDVLNSADTVSHMDPHVKN
jgi:ATP-dependent protease HslVU (ClpYQ) ATPase subunit